MDKSNHRLLVVDDDPINLDMLARRLERYGYTILRAAGGTQALQYLKTGNVDLVLLDHQMPDMTGLEVLRRMRLEHSNTALPIIMVTAASDPTTVLEAVTLGANDFVTKPVDLARILGRIRWHMGQRQREPAPRKTSLS